jgi:hypothetical protein
LENSIFYRIMGTAALLFTRSCLFADAFIGITLLPPVVTARALSGSNSIPCAGISFFCTTATVEQLTQIFITELASGILCLAGSLFVAFFRFEYFGPGSPISTPQVSIPRRLRPSELSTEELVAELKERVQLIG